ncbi:PspC domain-containing protein [Pontibacter korlensis]|uniref:PspC family transcriptional regulator n=1 Tax=Pontibacter korlensis TaxID=400092 RepID=A0A0E3UXP6_9BACT|nr:PspC domain-containing protein [Pontibacter korlensis]AKD04447.1 PspC family transcriptional regulator [Pontibacter korlensis]
MKRLQYFIESQAFGVCAMLGEKLGFASSSIRLTFIYVSFLTMGSPVLLYLMLAFWMNVSKHLRRERSTVWDL